jgi:hypothetical protein
MIFMKWKSRDIPDPPNKIDSSTSSKNTPGGIGLEGTIIDEVGIICDYGIEVYYKVFQVIQYAGDDVEYGFRLSYWRYNEKKNCWIWGQYNQIISPDEWEKLYQKAKEKGFFTKYNNNISRFKPKS